MDHKSKFVELNLFSENSNKKDTKVITNDKKKLLLEENDHSKDTINSRETSKNKNILRSSEIPNPDSIQLVFGANINQKLKLQQNKTFGNNRILTTKYNIFTWLPKTFLMQFMRFANVYFLIISVLQCFPFSPKQPQAQIFAFSLVLLFSMIREAIEDIKRYKMDKEINNKITSVYNRESRQTQKKQFQELIVGDIVKITKNEPLPADLLLIKSSLSSGLCFLDTKDLDGETNLKEKMINSELFNLDQETLFFSTGKIRCSKPNELMESWDANISIDSLNLSFSSNIKNLLLKGSVLRNTEYIYGLVVYCGHNTKIMMNAKKPRSKMSNVVKLMNTLLISIFLFLILMSAFFSLGNLVFNYEYESYITIYVSINSIISIKTFIIQFLVFVVAYSHLIPISMYVAMEIVKIMQSWFIFYDEFIYDKVSDKPTTARTSELIEELGQVDIVFSDKTGTLTQNSMEFKKCLVRETIYGDNWIQYAKHSLDLVKEKKHINGDTKAYDIINGDNLEYPAVINSNPEKAKLIEFFFVASVCHSALAEKDEFGEVKYSSMSPDEIALINGAKDMGFVFTERTTDTIEVINQYTFKSEIWEILYEVPFDSDRKRMTMFVKNKEDKNNVVFVLSKGADNIMLPRLIRNESVEKCAAGKIFY